MGIREFLIKRKTDTQLNSAGMNQASAKTAPVRNLIEKQYDAILNQEIQEFFPLSGQWYSSCFAKPDAVLAVFLPCHLRDTEWMSQLLHKNLRAMGRLIPQDYIKKFIDTSAAFATLRHNYELRIVKWQIDWIMHDGENWLMPDGCDELSLMMRPDVDQIVRGGVVKTLSTIGMDHEVIEEGLEKFADDWRLPCMQRGFRHEFEPIKIVYGEQPVENLPAADNEHRDNWVAAREYAYYQNYKKSVDQYGTLTPAMKMTEAEYAQLSKVLEKQNQCRANQIKRWAQTRDYKLSHLAGLFDPRYLREQNLQKRDDETIIK